MKIFDRVKKAYRERELRRILAQKPLTLEQVRRAVELVIQRAHQDEAAGVRKDRWLYEFESSIEDVMDGMQEVQQSAMHHEDEGTPTPQNGNPAACEMVSIYEKLYDFAVYAMEDSYMPLYLYILYRYANSLLGIGEAAKALPLFVKLVEKTDRLIGIRNPYGIRCYERVAAAAAQAGDMEAARRAIGEMHKIAIEEFGLSSAMTMAVRKYASRTGIMHRNKGLPPK